MKNRLTILAFVFMLAVFTLFIALPGDEASVLKENRIPASMPSVSLQNIFLGSFPSEFEDYLSDNVGMRGKLINISNKIGDLKGFKSYGYISNANADLGTGNTDADKGLLVADGKIMEIFKEKPKAREKYIDMINFYAEKLPENIRLYSMLIPTQIEFQQKKYSSLADSQKKTIYEIYSAANARIDCIDAYSALESHKNEYIYFRTDHHWTTLGAYYAFCEFAKSADVGVTDISEYDEQKLEGFLGYLYNQAQASELKNTPDDIYYYTKGENFEVDARAWENGEIINYKTKLFVVPTVGEEVKYSIFLGGDHPLLSIDTDVNNSRRILVLKDSYANAFIPWLTGSFERVVAVDPRSFGGDLGEVIEEYNITDVLLMNYTFTTTFEDIIELEKGIYK